MPVFNSASAQLEFISRLQKLDPRRIGVATTNGQLEAIEGRAQYIQQVLVIVHNHLAEMVEDVNNNIASHIDPRDLGAIIDTAGDISGLINAAIEDVRESAQ